MAQSLSNILIHIIFSTGHRKPFIQPDILQPLHNNIVGIARTHDSFVYEIGGVEDHVHILLTLPRILTISKLVEEIKKSSSKWAKTQGNDYREFHWQHGYGAFSIGQSNVEALRNYIQNQKEHHRKLSFQEEYRAFLKKYKVAFDEKYVWE